MFHVCTRFSFCLVFVASDLHSGTVCLQSQQRKYQLYHSNPPFPSPGCTQSLSLIVCKYVNNVHRMMRTILPKRWNEKALTHGCVTRLLSSLSRKDKERQFVLKCLKLSKTSCNQQHEWTCHRTPVLELNCSCCRQQLFGRWQPGPASRNRGFCSPYGSSVGVYRADQQPRRIYWLTAWTRAGASMTTSLRHLCKAGAFK